MPRCYTHVSRALKSQSSMMRTASSTWRRWSLRLARAPAPSSMDGGRGAMSTVGPRGASWRSPVLSRLALRLRLAPTLSLLRRFARGLFALPTETRLSRLTRIFLKK